MPISCIILSGGRATRMGGIDKGLAILQERPLIEHVISRVALQADEIMISANREIAQYMDFGLPILQDIDKAISSSPIGVCTDDYLGSFIGPLAGIRLGLKYARYEYLLVVPCDSPLLPLDLANRLMTSLIKNNVDIAVASSNGDAHPVFCLCKKNVLPSLLAYLASGERRVSAWQKSQKMVNVDFNDSKNAFNNLNTIEDITALEQTLNRALN